MAQILACVNQLFRKALQIDERGAQIVRHAIDERFVFLGLLTQRFVRAREFAGAPRQIELEARLQPFGLEQAPAGFVQRQIEPRDFVGAGVERRERLVAREPACIVRQQFEPAADPARKQPARNRDESQRAEHSRDDQHLLPRTRRCGGARARYVEPPLFGLKRGDLNPKTVEHISGREIAETFDDIGAPAGTQQVLHPVRPLPISLHCLANLHRALHLRRVVRDRFGKAIDAPVGIDPQRDRRGDIARTADNRATQPQRIEQHGFENGRRLAQHVFAMHAPVFGLPRIRLRLDDAGQQRQFEDGRNRDQQTALSLSVSCKRGRSIGSPASGARETGHYVVV